MSNDSQPRQITEFDISTWVSGQELGPHVLGQVRFAIHDGSVGVVMQINSREKMNEIIELLIEERDLAWPLAPVTDGG